MTTSGESQKETIGMKLEMMSAKTKIRIGFWNVRTTCETGKLAQVTTEMRRYNLHVLGVSESRWIGTGRLKTVSGETVLYSGRDDELHREGVAVILKKGADRSLLEWKPINSRLIKARLKGKQNNLTLIQCYAPTNDSEDDMKDNFYRRSPRDFKVRRGADIGSDYHLETACLKLKLKRAGRLTKGRSRFDVSQLKHPNVRKSFILEVRNRFEAVKEWMSPDTWKAIGSRRRLKKKVMDAKSQRLKERHQEMYRAANKEVKRRTRADKRKYIENLASQAEEEAARNEQGTVYKIIKIITGKCHITNVLVKDKNGILLTSEGEQQRRWTKHFRELLDRPPPPTVVPNIQEAATDLDISTDVPTRRKIIQAINSLKNGKAPGHDNLNAELFKADPELAATILTPLFTKIWEREEIPTDWSRGVIIKIPKKGSLSDCNNWRGITLLSVPSKIFCKVSASPKLLTTSCGTSNLDFARGVDVRNILEQCTEWNRELYVNFIDYEKRLTAFTGTVFGRF